MASNSNKSWHASINGTGGSREPVKTRVQPPRGAASESFNMAEDVRRKLETDQKLKKA